MNIDGTVSPIASDEANKSQVVSHKDYDSDTDSSSTEM